LAQAGNVQRHVVRGPPLADPRAQKKLEDTQSWAGMRDPADLAERWPQLWAAMRPVCDTILAFREQCPDLADLTAAFGDSPSREPPLSENVLRLRRLVGQTLGIAPEKVDDHAWNSAWRFELVRAVQGLSRDPDDVLPEWLAHGAPMGIEVPILDG